MPIFTVAHGSSWVIGGEVGTIGGRAADLFAVDDGALGYLELDHLIAEVVGVGRDAGIAVNPALIVY